jgi:predicted transcriptional regulator
LKSSLKEALYSDSNEVVVQKFELKDELRSTLADFFDSVEPQISQNELSHKTSQKAKKLFFSPPIIDAHEVISKLTVNSDEFNLWRQRDGFRFLWLCNLDLSHRDLKHTQWKNCALFNVDFSHSDLCGASFEGSILRKVDFFRAKVQGCDFDGVDLNDTLRMNRENQFKSDVIPQNHWLAKTFHVNQDEDFLFELSKAKKHIFIQILKVCQNPLSKADIAKQSDLKTKSKVFKALFKELLNKELIIMTIPEKPTSSNQKYYTSPKGLKLYQAYLAAQSLKASP